MSKIIKAAELRVLVPNESQTVIPAPKLEKSSAKGQKGTILHASNLISSAQDRAAQLLEEAQKEADQLLGRAQTEAERLQLRAKEAGFEQGHQEGFLQGEQEALSQASSLLQLLEEIMRSGAAKRAEALKTLEEDFLKFSMILADKIVKRAINEDVSWLKPIVEEGLARLGTIREVVVRLHPEDYALIQQHQDQLQLEENSNLKFEIDPNIIRGGCVLESENGAIDARLEKRLGKLAEHLLEVQYNGEN